MPFVAFPPSNIIITKCSSIATHLVGNTGVQPVQASNDMGHVQKGSSILHHLGQHRVCLGKFPTVTKKYIIKKFQKLHCTCHLVENVIPEELEHVPVAGLRPGLVQVQFSSIDLKNISIVIALIGLHHEHCGDGVVFVVVLTTVPSLVSNRKSLALSRSFASSTSS